MVRRDGSMLIGTSVLLLIMLRDLALSRMEGIFLLALLVGYIGYLLYMREESHEELSQEPFRWTDIPLFLAGITVVVLSGHYFVEEASVVARFFGISEWVIGVTIVAFGTSAPEIATSGIALARGQAGLSAGNLNGSDLLTYLACWALQPLAPNGVLEVDRAVKKAIHPHFVCVYRRIPDVAQMEADPLGRRTADHTRCDSMDHGLQYILGRHYLRLFRTTPKPYQAGFP